jgi:hypothetical protein
MAHRKTSKRSKAKTILRLPDLEQSKNAVLHSLATASSQESYGHAIDEFIGWYCSEPRLAFNRTAVLRYRFFLEQKNLAPSTINVRLAAVRRLAYEASDTASDKISPLPRCNKNRSLAIACRLFTSDFDIQSRGEFRAFLLSVFSVLQSFDRFIVGRKYGQPISANRDLVDGDPPAAERTGAGSKQ